MTSQGVLGMMSQEDRVISQDGPEMINQADLGMTNQGNQADLGMINHVGPEMTNQGVLEMTNQGDLGMTSQDDPEMINQDDRVIDLRMIALREGRPRASQGDLVMNLQTEIALKVLRAILSVQQKRQ